MNGESDVLVVGAGPTGLTTALTAEAHGARVRVVDRRHDPVRPSRALMLHARALECLRPLGVTQAILDRADTAPEARLHVGARVVPVRLGHVDLPDTAFAHLTLVRQADVEEALRTAVDARGIRVEWGTEFLGVRSRSDVDSAPVASLRRLDGRHESHQCRFIAGCDGQSSTVRGVMGATWRGAPYRVEALLADLELEAALDPGLLHVWVGTSGLAFLFALGEGATWRLLATRPAEPASDAPFGQLGPAVAAVDVRRALGRSGIAVAPGGIRWSSRVALQRRVAEPFRRGALFVAGDAAHAHSPAGGQGMNNGILDAANLGWKLALAATGRAGTELLDSYDTERRRAAREVLALTRLLFFAEASPNPVARFMRGALLPAVAPLLPGLLRRRRLTAAAVRLLAQPYVRYRHSGLSCDAAPRVARWPRPGDRLPDRSVMVEGGSVRLHELTARPGIHVLLERDARPPADLLGGQPLLHVHRLVDHPGGAAVAVRPDGHVGFRSGEAGRPLEDWLGMVGALAR